MCRLSAATWSIWSQNVSMILVDCGNGITYNKEIMLLNTPSKSASEMLLLLQHDEDTSITDVNKGMISLQLASSIADTLHLKKTLNSWTWVIIYSKLLTVHRVGRYNDLDGFSLRNFYNLWIYWKSSSWMYRSNEIKYIYLLS